MVTNDSLLSEIPMSSDTVVPGTVRTALRGPLVEDTVYLRTKTNSRLFSCEPAFCVCFRVVFPCFYYFFKARHFDRA